MPHKEINVKEYLKLKSIKKKDEKSDNKSILKKKSKQWYAFKQKKNNDMHERKPWEYNNIRGIDENWKKK